ncbi:MAG: hypothetical protein ACSHX0_08030 [Akkermansiaceae bacterium]
MSHIFREIVVDSTSVPNGITGRASLVRVLVFKIFVFLKATHVAIIGVLILPILDKRIVSIQAVPYPFGY